MKISVILPCFNGAKTIAQQMEALCHQSWVGGWEVIVANNGSTDDSMAIVERYRKRLPELRIIEAHRGIGPRQGASHSYNVGLAAATGDAFVLCEADDQVGEGWLQAMGEGLREHRFVVARMAYQKLNPAWLCPSAGRRHQERKIPQIGCYPYLKFAWGCTFGFRRQVYEQLGGFNSDFSYVFDAEYCWRAQREGFDIQLIQSAVMHYRLRHELKALFRQKRSWGEEFRILMRCYGTPPGKLVWIRSRVRLLGLLLMGLIYLPGSWLRLPYFRRALYELVEKLSWHLGDMAARTAPLPFEVPVSGETALSAVLQ